MEHNLKTLKVVLLRNPKEALNELKDVEKELREFDIMKWLDENHPDKEQWVNLGAEFIGTLRTFIQKEILG